MILDRRTVIQVVAVAFCAFGLALLGGCADAGESAETPGGAASTPAAEARVDQVVDGDTAFITIDGSRETVRFVGIDAPESDGPYRDTGCFGPEAAGRLRELLPSGTAVRVMTDPAQESSRDRFDRLLAYVFREGEETSINQQMVAEGMALVFVFRDDPFGKAESFQRSEDQARKQKLGVWGACGPDARAPRATPESSQTTDERSCPMGAPIKGNLPSAIYHSPGDENYEKTNPERCFASAAEAEAEGFRAAGR